MGTSQNIAEFDNDKIEPATTKFTCGIVMPIASMGDYTESHWSDVYSIIKEAVNLSGYEARLVSESKDSTVIPKSIVQNLYDDDIVICDVSGKNPNVMFELGMRLAFDKPVVLIKDTITGYSFDTSTIEHLSYPRDLRYSEIQRFKTKLAEKIVATYKASQEQGYRSFLSNFATIKIARLEQTTLSESEVLETILYKLDQVESKLKEHPQSPKGLGLRLYPFHEERIFCTEDELKEFTEFVENLYGSNIIVRTKPSSMGGIDLILISRRPLNDEDKSLILMELKPRLDSLDELPF
ncbi:hypothetical protein [Acinetobacter sp. ANC 3882]|uniref:hypothetical protein n=1 Tax=Acinetobacter sp. ANC 3882 TaxID=2923423 RepID=UPI001F4B7EDE|nr:hypothetical protein [Acinetobacter sp. ANC 3882]MCH7315698.1 hypothetical protein [Acinetobacter sp. ANC 3882]